MRRALAAGATALLLAVAACSPGDSSGPSLPGPPDVDVDTAELRAAKAAAGVADCVPGTGTHVDGGLPDVTLPCLGGGPDVNVSGLRGPLVVNLWAVWCGPCRNELPIYQQFHERHSDRVGVLGIDYNDVQVDQAMDLVRETGVTFPLLADPAMELSSKKPLPNLKALPFLALVDSDGRVVHKEFVEIKSLEQLEDLVAQHLGVTL